MSKGDTYRPVDQKKYDRNYLRVYGDPCTLCETTGTVHDTDGTNTCPRCGGVGYVERKHS